MSANPQTGPVLYKPATAIRIDNDAFLGTPLPPEEPTASNPPRISQCSRAFRLRAA